MTIEVSRRIHWRLEELKKKEVSLAEVELAIMEEAGTDERTIYKHIKLLIKLKLLTRLNRWRFNVCTQAL